MNSRERVQVAIEHKPVDMVPQGQIAALGYRPTGARQADLRTGAVMPETMRIELPYGDRRVAVCVPRANLLGVFTSRRAEVTKGADVLIADALAKPIGTPRLSRLVRPGMRVAILCDDKTRPTPVATILPAVLDELAWGGVPDRDACVVFALGTHRPMSDEEMRARAGPAAAARVKLYQSRFRSPEGMKTCGRAPGGVEVAIDRRAAEADVRIGIGSIMPHPECGWSGGATILCPGVSSQQTVTAFHLSFARVDWNPYGSTESPVRLNMERWVDAVGLDFIVNSVVTAEGQIAAVVAGHYVQAHRRGVAEARELYGVRIPRKADIVLITSFRADEDFWLASKALFAGELAVRDGGTLILSTPCKEGVGPHPQYADYCGDDNCDQLAQAALGGKIQEPIAVSAGVAIAKMRRRLSIWIASDGLTPAEVARMKCRHFPDADAALKAALRQYGARARVAVFPDGIATVPTIAPPDDR